MIVFPTDSLACQKHRCWGRTCKADCRMRGIYHRAHIGQCIHSYDSPDLQRVILQITPPRHVEDCMLLKV